MISEDMKVWNDYWVSTHGALEDFCKLVAARAAAAEREACAKVCEGLRPSKPEYDQRFNDGCTLSAAAIRARGEV